MSMILNYSSGSLEDRLKLHFTPSHVHSRQAPGRETTPISTPDAKEMFEYVSYEDVDSGQRLEFEKLLKKVGGFFL